MSKRLPFSLPNSVRCLEASHITRTEVEYRLHRAGHEGFVKYVRRAQTPSQLGVAFLAAPTAKYGVEHDRVQAVGCRDIRRGWEGSGTTARQVIADVR